MGFLEEYDQMAREHAAWLDVGKEFRQRGIDMNDPAHASLAAAITKWGEELVTLRVSQDEEVRARVLAETRQKYAAVGPNGQYERGTYPES